jgi:MFS family permease
VDSAGTSDGARSEEAAGSEADAERVDHGSWAPLSAVCLTMFIVVLDPSMMNVAVPQITRDLDTTVSGVQGAISMYSLVMSALMLAGAKLGAIHGVRRVFEIALVVYGAGTLIAALSWTLAVLTLGWSFIEGLAAAALLPLSMTLIVANYSGPGAPLRSGSWAGSRRRRPRSGPSSGASSPPCCRGGSASRSKS